VNGINPKFPTCKKQKIEKTQNQRKTITRTKQYLRGSAIYLRPRSCRDFTIIRKKYKVRQYNISVSQERQQHKTLITKKRFLHPAHRIHNGLQNEQKKFPRGVAPDPQTSAP